jgi:hypothetical protein
MNLRHAAALALVGWYLMVPPLTEDGHPARLSGPISPDSVWGVEFKAPLSKWELNGTYNSASQCNEERETRSERIRKETHWPEGSRSWAFGEDFIDSQCIASDDPRLKEKLE